MEFEISRTSDCDKKPCEEAYRGMKTWIDERVLPLEIISDRKDWYKKGFNHRVENGNIMRDFEDEYWLVEIKDLTHLIKFVRLHGAIILSDLKIEIYDDYR